MTSFYIQGTMDELRATINMLSEQYGNIPLSELVSAYGKQDLVLV